MNRKLMAGLVMVLVLFLSLFAFQGEKAAKSDTTLVLYNSVRVGVVEKTLALNLKEGMNEIPLGELAGLDIAEVTVRPLDEGVRVLGVFSRGQSGDVYSANVGSDVELKLRDGKTVSGKFLGFKNGRIAVEGNSYYLINPDEVVYFKVKNLEGKANVYAVLQADKAGKYAVSVTYRVPNMSWESRYKLYIGDNARLYGYILMNNPTAQDFKGAKVLLVAGEVQLMKNGGRPGVLYAKAGQEAGEINAGRPEKMEAFYLYKLGVLDVRAGSRMMFPYITLETPYEREYLYESWARNGEGPVYESISFRTGRVLPAGTVEIYRETPDGAVLIGERSIEHTPKGDVLRIGIGREYDIKGTTKVLEHRAGDGYSYYKVRITLQNFGNETKTVIVRHHKWGKVTYASLQPLDETADYVEFSVTLRPGEKREITFEYGS